MRKLQVLLLSFSIIALASASAHAAPIISSAFINYSTSPSLITINGKYLIYGTTYNPKYPTKVYFNGTAPLSTFKVLTNVGTPTGAAVTAQLPSPLPPGTYVVRVQNPYGISLPFDVTYGAAGPRGPQGPAGVVTASPPLQISGGGNLSMSPGLAAGQVMTWNGAAWNPEEPYPAPGSSYYIQSSPAAAQSANINISGSGSFGSVASPGTIAAGSFQGNGSGLTNVTASGIQSGTTAQRPASPNTGNLRYNTDTASTEIYNGASWANIGPRNIAFIQGAELFQTNSITPVAVTGRELTFTKKSSTSLLRITYSDNFGASAYTTAQWQIYIDSQQTSPSLLTYVYNPVSNTWLIVPGTIIGYASGIPAGNHTVQVYASVMSSNSGYCQAGSSFGNSTLSSFLLEVEEIPQ